MGYQENTEASLASILEATTVDSRELIIVGIKHLPAHGIKWIGDKIQNCLNLDKVVIEICDPTYENSLTYQKIKPLIPIFWNHPSLTKVGLPNSRIDGLEQFYLTRDIVQNNKRIHTLDFRSNFKEGGQIVGDSFYGLLTECDSLVHFTNRNKSSFLLKPPDLHYYRKEYYQAAKNIIFHGDNNHQLPSYLSYHEPVVSRNMRAAKSLLKTIIDGRVIPGDSRTIEAINDRLPAILALSETLPPVHASLEEKGQRISVIKKLLDINENVPRYASNIPVKLDPYLTFHDANTIGIDWPQAENKPQQPRGFIARLLHPSGKSLA